MPQQFIHPNWHVLTIHLPLGLIAVGLIIEIFSFLWPRSTVRAAGRWMLLLGALGCIPAVTLGLYAYRDVVAMGINTEDAKWSDVLAQSPWTDAQKTFMFRHIWLAVGATAVFVITALVYLASSDHMRRRLYWPALLLFIAGFGALSTAAWYSGESVYTQATAVTLARNPQAAPRPDAVPGAVPTTQPVPALQPSTAPGADAAGNAHELEEERERLGDIEGKIAYFLPPMQLHVLFAGLMVAFGLGALGVTIRRWAAETEALERLAQTTVIARRLDLADEATRREEEAEPIVVPTSPHTPPAVIVPPPPVFPARIWLAALILGALTAAAGLWLNEDWKLKALIDPFKDAAQRHDILRLWLHILFGLSIVLLTTLLALVTRFSRRQRGFTTLLMILFGLAVAGQLWLGILLLYDSPHGPVTRFFGLSMSGACYIGCSGWNYKHWAGGRFYPKGLAQRKWLEYYAGQFNTVEINNSFYRIPLPDTMTKWAETVPPDFKFAVKVWRGITHYRKLNATGEFLRRFLEFADRLEAPRRGPLLLQLPPNMGKNLTRLEEFLGEFRSATRASPWRLTIEFRNTQWLGDDVYRLLDAHKVAVSLVDGRCPATEPNDVDFVYVRRHGGPQGGNYTHAEIAADAKAVKKWLRAGKTVYVYFNNDWQGYAVDNARELMKLVGLKPPKPASPRPDEPSLYN